MSCTIDSKSNMRLFKRVIKEIGSSTAKERIRFRISADSLCVHTMTSASGPDHNGRLFVMKTNFFKSLSLSDKPALELDLDMKTVGQSVVKTKEQGEFVIQLKQKQDMAEAGGLHFFSTRDAFYDKITKLRGNVTPVQSHRDLAPYMLTNEVVGVECQPDTLDKVLSIFVGESEVLMLLKRDAVEFRGKEHGSYTVSSKAFSKYVYPLPTGTGTKENLTVTLPLETVDFVASVAKERGIPVKIAVEVADPSSGNVFVFCDAPAGEFKCVGTALGVRVTCGEEDQGEEMKEPLERKVEPRADNESENKKRSDLSIVRETVAMINEIGKQEEEQKSAGKIIQETLSLINATEVKPGTENSKKEPSQVPSQAQAQGRYFGGSGGDQYI